MANSERESKWDYPNLRKKRTILVSIGFRILLLFILWLALTLPVNPGWRIGGSKAFHIVAALILFGYIAAFIKLRASNRFLLFFGLINILELLAMTFLVWATGGIISPFAILYLLLITGTLFLWNLRITLVASLSGIAFYGVLILFMSRGYIPAVPAFKYAGNEIPLYENGTFMASMIFVFGLFAIYTVALNIFLFRLLRTQHEQIGKQSSKLEDATQALITSFHDMESMSDRLKIARQNADSARQTLMKLEKVASLGQMASGIINEFGSPLSSIISDTELMLMVKDMPSETKLRETFKRTLTNATRIKTLMQNLKESIKPADGLQTEIFDLNTLVMRVTSLKTHEMKKHGIEFRANCDSANPKIFGVQSQIEQVIVSLLSNAENACLDKGGKIVIKTGARDNSVYLKVTDTGYGIQKHDLSRIFEPFYTTHNDENHVGLGLYLVANIVDAHQGHILLESEPGVKTTFTVVFPEAPAKAPK